MHRPRWKSAVTAALVAVLAAGATFQMWQIRVGIEGVQQQLKTLRPRGKPMNEATASWTSGGILVEVTRQQEPGESDAQFAARFKAVVEAMKIEFPVD